MNAHDELSRKGLISKESYKQVEKDLKAVLKEKQDLKESQIKENMITMLLERELLSTVLGS